MASNATRGYWARNGARIHYVFGAEARTLCGRDGSALARVHVADVGTCGTCARVLTARLADGSIAPSARALTSAELAAYVNACREDMVRMRARIVADTAADGGMTRGIADAGGRWQSTAPARGAVGPTCETCAHVSCIDMRAARDAMAAWRAEYVGATTYDAPATRRTVERSHMPDAPSRVFGVSPGVTARGVHSPILGATEWHDDDDARADAWRYVATCTMTDRFHAGVFNTLRKLAHAMGRTPDLSERDDVAQCARDASVGTLATLMTRADVTRTYVDGFPACELTDDDDDLCEHSVCERNRAGASVADVATFNVPRERRCGECEGCAEADELGMSRWNVNACDEPVESTDVVAPSQVISRHVMAYARASMRTAARLGITRDGETAGEDAPSVDVDAFGHLPDDVADVLSRAMVATYAAGDDVTRDGNGMSDTMASMLALSFGLAPTAAGRRLALDRVRDMRATAERRARAVVSVPVNA